MADVELLVDVRELAARVFEEELADEHESAREEVQKQAAEENGERPAVLAEKEYPIRREEFQLAHEIKGDGKQKGKG